MKSIHHTPRLLLRAATLEHLEAELADPARLEALLGVRLPAGWPPGDYDRDAMLYFRDFMVAHPDLLGWLAWYAILPAEGETPATLVAAVGYFGPPRVDGTVEIGYSVAPSYEGRGLATEAVAGLIELAFAEAAVTRIVAHCDEGNFGSIRVLERNGFEAVADYAEPGRREFVLLRPG